MLEEVGNLTGAEDGKQAACLESPRNALLKNCSISAVSKCLEVFEAETGCRRETSQDGPRVALALK